MKKRLYNKLGIKKGLTSIIGSGGKTTLIKKLAGEMKKDGFSVIITTTTKIFVPDFCPLVCNPSENREMIDRLIEENGIVAVGRPVLTQSGAVKLGKCETEFEELVKAADFVLVEADGSKHMPLKAHAEYEPVIPDCTNRIIQVADIAGIGKTAVEAVHRFEIFISITGSGADEIVTGEAVAEVINQEKLADVLYISGINEENRKLAEKLSKLINIPAVMEE